MTLNISARISADVKQAQAAIRATVQDVDLLGQQGRETSAEFETLRRAFDALQAEMASLRTDNAAATKQLAAMGAEMDKLRAKTQQTRAPIDNAAGSVGNLTAQFNDIGVMLAAGQNPLQLAIQQGTQIGQVFAQTGVKGKDAFKLILSGVTSMFSPINLITIGAIAMGAALVNWLTSSAEQADHFAERLDNARAKVDELRFENRFLTSGLGSPEQLALQDEIDRARAELNRVEGQLTPDQAARGRQLGLDIVREYDARVEAARKAVEAAEAELAALQDLEVTNQQLTAEQEEAKRLAEETAKRRERDLATADEMLRAIAEENELTRVGLTFGEDGVMLERARADASRAALERSLEGLDVSEDLKDAIRAAHEESLRLASVDIATGIGAGYRMARALADELQRAVGAAISLSAQGIDGLRTAEIEWQFRDDPVGRAGALAGERFDSQVGDTTGFDPIVQQGLAQQREAFIANAQATEELRQKTIEWRREQAAAGRAAGGAAKATAKERDAVRDLIATKTEELAILRETDPVQQEMIRLRGELAAATDAERAAVETLIATRFEEQRAQEQLAETSEFFRSSFADLVPSLVRGGDEAASSWQRFARALEDAAWQALLLGEGPLMGLLGGGGGGGWGGIFGFIGSLFGLADGGGHDRVGMHYGLGGPRADKMPILVSPGEFTVNAKATQQHRALLEAINAGAPIPGFAAGGLHGGGTPILQPTVITQQFINETAANLRMSREERTQPDGSRLERFVIAEAVSEGLTTRGGAARRTLQQAFGVQPKRLMR